VIVVDSSAILAILRLEPESEALALAIERDGQPAISVATVLECLIVARSKLHPEDSDPRLDRLLEAGGFERHPVTVDHLDVARRAHVRFGKGTGHPAQLNFGDCFSYALAKVLNVPLLYKGNDFARTDIVSALA
jgi:ribonuclease VapC